MLLRPKLFFFFHYILSRSVSRALLISGLLWILSFTYCRHRFWRNPHSAFFSFDGAYDFHYSADRQKQSQAYTSYASQSTQHLPKGSGKPDICAAFVTVKRENKQYVDEAVASMLEGLNGEERLKLSLQVLFADTNTQKHPSWEEKWLRNAVDGMVAYNVRDKTMSNLKKWEIERDFYSKGVFDYVYALKICYDTNAPYVIMFEDDIIVADGWMAKTLEALQSINSKSSNSKSLPSGLEIEDWIYLRLFYTETAISWENEDFWYFHMWLTFFLASSIGLVVLLAVGHFSISTRRHLDQYTIGAICGIVIPAFAALIFMCGKYSIFPPSTVFAMNKHRYCTQGLLFPRSQIPGLMNYLEERKSGQTDTMIEEYADTHNKQRLAMGKQLLQHVGLTSSRDNTFINAQSTWAFWFETYDVRTLRNEKEEARRKLGFQKL